MVQRYKVQAAVASHGASGSCSSSTMKVVFVHLDLGIGGAEMLVVNAAVAAKEAGHEVIIYTSHHDPERCFEDTKRNGVLAGLIRVRGDWLPRHLFFGRFTALCAVCRMLWLSLCVLWSERSVGAVFCDGVSAPVPLLRLAGPVLFYCHFPDKLLCVKRGSLFKRLYRVPLDMVEEFTTGCATSIAVNSKFTAEIFREAFSNLGRRFSAPNSGHSPGVNAQTEGKKLRVLYPPTNVKAYAERSDDDRPSGETIGPVVSLNRFERKKHLHLAVEALGWAIREMGQEEAFRKGLRLIIAGGYDERVSENVEHLQELKACVESLGLEACVEFRRNIGDEERSTLLRQASCVLYTPSNEHFGIVPVEAMCSEAPVIAANSGGPLETVVDGKTGFLCDPTAEAFGSAILKLARDREMGVKMGKEGRRRVHNSFSMESFAGAFESSLQEMAAPKPSAALNWLGKGFLFMTAFFGGCVMSLVAKDLHRRQQSV